MTDLINLSPEEFVVWLKKEGIPRFFFVYDTDKNKVVTSDERLQPITNFIESDRRDFRAHEGLFFQVAREFDVLLGAFVHKTKRGQGAGGTRFWRYATVKDFILDGLRLSKGMTRKNSLAGLWWGGGKGVIARDDKIDNKDPKVRESIFKQYGELVSAIDGCYVTAEDVGTNVTDMGNIFKATRFMTCTPSEVGGSGNPSTATARGVVCAMEAVMEFLDTTLEGKIIAVQGTGHVGGEIIRFLFEKNVGKIIAYDINAENIAQVKEANRGQNLIAEVVERNDNSILETECDILAPCATGAILNAESIPKIKAKIVCGAANNQLEDSARDDKLLADRGIIYVPDFLANRMGIVNCSNEQYGRLKDDPAIEKHLSRDWEYSVHQTTLRVLEESRESGDPPGVVATRHADELSEQTHPIFGHRGKQIIDDLVKRGWQKVD